MRAPERPKRFYEAAAAAPVEGGYGVMLERWFRALDA